MSRSITIAALASLLSAGIFATPGQAQAQVRFQFPGQDSQGGYFPPGTPNQGVQDPNLRQGMTPRPFGGFSPERQAYPTWQGRPVASPWPPNPRHSDSLDGRSITQPPPPPYTQTPSYGQTPPFSQAPPYSQVPPYTQTPPLGQSPLSSMDQLPFLLPELRPGAHPFGPSTYQRGYAGPAPTGSAIAGLADLLASQADEFLQAFRLDARQVPQGALFLADATTLRNAAIRFRSIADQGAPPEVLTAEFQAVAGAWQQLEGRMAVVSRGRIGPNIATALQMGQTVEQIGRQLY